MSVRTMERAKQEVAAERIDEELAARIDQCLQASSHVSGDLRRQLEADAQRVRYGDLEPETFLCRRDYAPGLR